MRSAGNGVLIATIVAALMNLGCYDWVAIRPSELPRLNGSRELPVGRNRRNNSVIMGRTRRDVSDPEGRLISIHGSFDARIRSTDGSEVVYEYPVRSRVADGNLRLRSSSHAPVVLPLEDIESVDVTQYNDTKSVLMTMLVGVGVVAFLGAAIGIPVYIVSQD